MYILKRIAAAALSALMCFSTVSYAKSNDYINYNIDKRREMLYEEDFRVFAENAAEYSVFKCIVSFNNYVADGDYYRYDMGNDPVLLENMRC